jgi:transketolase
MNNKNLETLSKSVRKEIFKFKTRTGNGHLASCLSIVDVLVSLFYDCEIFDRNRDKVIFSKAHGSPAIYPILADLNIINKDELDKYCLPNGILKLHSDGNIPGCWFVGGSLGNGIGYAAGRAFANKNSNLYVILGDAELYEGVVWETLLFIAHHKLNNIKLIVDRNKYGILGSTEELLKIDPLDKKFESFNFDVVTVDGHNFEELNKTFSLKTSNPLVIIANTIKGKGVSYMEDKYEYHTIIPKDKNQIEQGLIELS